MHIYEKCSNLPSQGDVGRLEEMGWGGYSLVSCASKYFAVKYTFSGACHFLTSKSSHGAKRNVAICLEDMNRQGILLFAIVLILASHNLTQSIIEMKHGQAAHV